MPRKQKADARIDDMRSDLIKAVGELWDEHKDRFMAVLEESESRTINVTFPVTLDFSESKAVMTTQIRFSEVFKDKRVSEFDDPNQPFLPGADPKTKAEDDDEGKQPGRKGKKGRKKKTGKDAASGDDTGEETETEKTTTE
jgi:hypothetical protein